VLAGGPWLYTAMGGRGASLDAALTYSNVVFAGAVLLWLFNSLANIALYFASQGAGRLAWPLIANLTRLTIAAIGGALALRLTGNLNDVFVALAITLAVFGVINAAAVAGGAWFGPLRLRSLLPLRRKHDLRMRTSIA